MPKDKTPSDIGPGTEELAERRRTLVIGAFVLLAIVIGGACAIYFLVTLRFPNQETNDSPSSAVVRTVRKAPASDYVGSEQCTKCHAEIAAKYAASAKANSLLAIDKAHVIEDYDAEPVTIGSASYRVSKDDEGVVRHHEYLTSVYDQAESIEYVVGSGKRERAYLLERSGVLYQSPFVWNATASTWQLMASNDQSQNPRFQTRVTDDCLRCHAGAVHSQAPRSNRYKTPIFGETAIGCEQCHGPGGRHVTKQEGLAASGQTSETPTGVSSGAADSTIVNPARLGTRRREHLCASCHLHGTATVARSGASLLDFRPGDLLDDVIGVLTPKPENDAEFRMASHTQQFRGSVCYVNSKGMVCSSCHDAHGEPAEEQRVAFYMEKCAKCHEDKGCSLSEAKRLSGAEQGSCIECHMTQIPTNASSHMTLTDHRVRRDPKAFSELATLDLGMNRWRPFDKGDERLPADENRRLTTLVIMKRAIEAKDVKLAQKTMRHLLRDSDDVSDQIDAIGDDVPTLSVVGEVFAMAKSGELAELVWQRILEYDPDHEATLAWMTVASFERGKADDVIKYSDRLLKNNPSISAAHTRRALALDARGRVEEALESANLALALDPTLIRVRVWLRSTLKETGQSEESAKQDEIIQQLKAAGYVELPQ